MAKIVKPWATAIGCGALVLWAVEPLLVSELGGLPPFEALALICLSSFLLTATRITITKRWSLIFQQPWLVWLIGLLGICGSDCTYLYGSRFAPIAHIDLIDYTWPCFIVLFISFLPKERLNLQYLFGSLVGLCGILILICKRGVDGTISIDLQHIIGYVLAFGGTLFWSGYNVFSRHFQAIPCEMIGMYSLLGGIIFAVCHFSLETTVIPSCSQLSLAGFLGVVGAGVAYQLWDHGIKFGNINLLSVSTYFARIVAMCLLVIFDKEPYSIELVLACAMTIVGVAITGIHPRYFTRLLSKFGRANKQVGSVLNAEEKSATAELL